MSKKSVFRSIWKDSSSYPTFSKWVEEDQNSINNARCRYCKAVFSLSNMGVRALSSHENSKKHIQNFNSLFRTNDIRLFGSSTSAVSEKATSVVPPQTTADAPSTVTSSTVQSSVLSALNSEVGPMNTFLKKVEVQKAEILWCLNVVWNHASLRTAAKSVSLFPTMFSDSLIAKSMQLQKDKVSYTICFGLAPYFEKKLAQHLKELPFVAVSFDESLNKVSQMNQMDIIVRFWSSTENKVVTRYLTSVFLGHSTSNDLIKAFKEALSSKIELRNIIQISMDGPAVNWKFLRELQDEIDQPDSQMFVQMGSCGLHVIHGAFKTGMNSTGWNIILFLRSIYNLFKNVPARRADYTRITESTEFPKKFCSVRWLSNAVVAQKALAILPKIEKYIHVSKKEKCQPLCSSFKTVEKALEDDLLSAQLAFFQSLASQLEPFLETYQTNEPLAPFLHDSVCNVLKSIMTRFVKQEILDAATSSFKLSKIDLDNPENLQAAKNINLGYETRSAIRDVKNSKHISDARILQFRQECKKCLVQCSKKILEKSPIKFKMTKGASCLSPENILNKKYGLNCLKQALEVFTDNKWFTGIAADSIERSYEAFCNNLSVIDMCKSFDRKTERLDVLFAPVLQCETNQSFVLFVQMILSFFHGNAAVERGFSVNSECLVENLSMESLIAQRTVYDAISSAGDVQKVEISKEMIMSVAQSNHRWKDALRKKKMLDEEKLEKQKKRKIQLKKLEELKEKRRKTVEEKNTSIKSLEEEIQEMEKLLDD